MNRKRLISIVVAAVIICTLAIGAMELYTMRGAVNVGLLEDQRGIFGDGELLAENLGRPVNIRYYEDYASMRRDIESGWLDIFTCTVFDHVANDFGALAVAAIKCDYVLAGNVRDDITVVGVFDEYVSSLLLGNTRALRDKKFSILKIEESDAEVYLKEGIIDFAVFRGSAPESLERDVKLSQLGYSHDMLLVRKDFILKNHMVTRAIFNSTDALSNRLPEPSEISGAINYVFLMKGIERRGDYVDYVYYE